MGCVVGGRRLALHISSPTQSRYRETWVLPSSLLLSEADSNIVVQITSARVWHLEKMFCICLISRGETNRTGALPSILELYGAIEARFKC